MENKPNKKLTVSGVVDTRIDGDEIIIKATGGLVAVTTTDLEGSVVYMFHPLSGWYKELDMRERSSEE